MPGSIFVLSNIIRNEKLCFESNITVSPILVLEY